MDELTRPVDQKKDRFFIETLKFTLLALIIVLPIRYFVAQPFIVSGASMDPTFYDGQYLVVDQLSKDFSAPARGEVIVFRAPPDPSKYFIKRVIGLPNETVEIKGSDVYIINKDHPDGFKLDEPYVYPANKSTGDDIKVTLGPNEYFVMGDNRRASSDSRAWGAVPASDLIGRPVLRLFPVNKATVLPGNYSYQK